MKELAQISLGSLVIHESETGSGKTEAAAAHFSMLYKKGLVDACYFALPTRTSAAQIHRRITIAMTRMFPEENMAVTLAVPGYMTGKIQENGLFFNARNMENDSSENWYSENSKRYLASTVAVGTIDQALLSVLNVKHSTLRWASMARSLIVFDEVHATDGYMSTLLESLINQHVARGGHVFLMSATLGATAAVPFLQAAGAVDQELPNVEAAQNMSYPLVRHVIAGRYTASPLPSDERSKHIEVSTAPLMDDPFAVASLAAEHVRHGAKVLIIRNTVKACVDVQIALEAVLSSDEILEVAPGLNIPHHGRFAAEDRLLIDRAIEKTFGKGSLSRGVVAVGTQTVEQSLDIDADIIITDLSPMDVLLQRLGRLHRHIKFGMRPFGYDRPRAIVLVPDHSIEQYAKKPGNGLGINRAYENVIHSILTLNEIKTRGVFVIPHENRMLVEACSHPDALEIATFDNELLKNHLQKAVGIGLAGKTIARSNLRKENWRYGETVIEQSPISSISRLGNMGVRINFENSEQSFSGELIKGIVIPDFLIDCDESSIDLSSESVYQEKEDIRFRVGNYEFGYGRHGLRKIS